MNRMTAFIAAALIAAMPVAASAHDPDQDRGPRGGRGGDRGGQMQSQPRQISMAEAQSIAQSRARGASYVGYMGQRGDSYVFRFERDGQVIDIAVSIYGR